MSDSRNLNNTCSVENCSNRCWKRVCKTCAFKMRMGTIPAEFGVTVNKPCTIDGCNEPTYTKKHVYCRNHYDSNWRGIAPEDKRPKRKNGSTPLRCEYEGCEEPRKSKGLCTQHYYQSRYVPTEKISCKGENCAKALAPGRVFCKRHKEQFDLYVFTWDKGRPKDKYAAWRDSQLTDCLVPKCGEKASSAKSALCRKHSADKGRKNCSESFYINLMSVDSCQSCGISEDKTRLVTDHDHACHPGDRMCEKCIRGRICDYCNSALGYALEDRGRLLALVAYLDRTSR